MTRGPALPPGGAAALTQETGPLSVPAAVIARRPAAAPQDAGSATGTADPPPAAGAGRNASSSTPSIRVT